MQLLDDRVREVPAATESWGFANTGQGEERACRHRDQKELLFTGRSKKQILRIISPSASTHF